MHNGLRIMTLWCGEESVSSAIIGKDMEIFRQKLACYDFKLICNVDETRLFFKMVTRTTYLSSSEDRAPPAHKGDEWQGPFDYAYLH